MTQPPSHDDHSAAARPAARRKRGLSRGRRFQLAAAALLVVSGLAGSGLACWLRPPDVSDHDDAPAGPLAHLFRDWDKPDLALIVTADQHGYLLPCGCSKPQKGGLERRYNFIQMLKDRGWPVAAVDLGNVPQVTAPADLPNLQGLIKYRYAMKAMKVMNYTAVGIGAHEAAMPLFDVLAEYALNEPEKPTVVSANLAERKEKFADMAKAWRQADPIKGVDLKVGVAGLIGPSVKDEMQKKDASLRIGDSRPALDAVLKEMDTNKIDLRVLLYMGSISKGWAGSPPEAVACAQAYPQFPLIVALDDGDLPRTDPIWATNAKTGAKTMIVALGEKAKYIGVVGVYRTNKPGQPFDLRYQLVEMTEDFATPAAQVAGQPVLKLMEEYTDELKRDNYLGKYAQKKHPMQATVTGKMPKYVGTDRCIECHPSAGKVWAGTAHSHAYQTLVDKTLPSNRQYDPECIVCHTVGFAYQTGFTSAEKTPKLKNVGCESCHGPGSLHANNPNDAVQRALLNPWKAPVGEKPVDKTRRLRRIDDFCQKCHDTENDVNWTENGFERNWPKIVHDTPPDEKADEPGDK